MLTRKYSKRPAPSASRVKPTDFQSLSSDQLLQLQRAVGNRAFQGVLDPAQRAASIRSEGGAMIDRLQGTGNFQSLSSDQLLQLQRAVGNRAIRRLLIGSEGGAVTDEIQRTINQLVGDGRPLDKTVAAQVEPANDTYKRAADGMADSSDSVFASAAVANSQVRVQRRLKFKPEQLVADSERTMSVADQGKRMMGAKTTYDIVKKALAAYWKIENNPDDPGRVRLERIATLKELKDACKNWFKEASPTHKAFMGENIAELQSAVERELKDEEFRAKYEKTLDSDTDLSNSLLEEMATGKFSYERGEKKLLKRGQKTKDQLSQGIRDNIETYENLKKLGLTRSEMLAIFAYTGDNYIFMNPAAAKNMEWLKSNMAKRGKQVDTKKIKKAMKINKEISAYAEAGLEKLPPWIQRGRTIYRGETLTKEEFKERIVPGKTKSYPHFVSTSLARATPLSQIDEWKTKERPYGVIYHITKTTRPGRDVAPLAKSGSGEQEILFPPNTTFVMGDLIAPDEEAKRRGVDKEIKVETT